MKKKDIINTIKDSVYAKACVIDRNGKKIPCMFVYDSLVDNYFMCSNETVFNGRDTLYRGEYRYSWALCNDEDCKCIEKVCLKHPLMEV